MFRNFNHNVRIVFLENGTCRSQSTEKLNCWRSNMLFALLILLLFTILGPVTLGVCGWGGGGWGIVPLLFCITKILFCIAEQNLFKDCYQGQNVTVLAIVECLVFKNFPCRPTMVANNTFQCSMAPFTLKSISPALMRKAIKA